MSLDTLIALVTLAALAWFALEDMLRPLRKRGSSVNNSSVRRPARLRSRRSGRSNVMNAGSTHQNAKAEGSNVQPNVQRSVPPAENMPPAIAPTGTNEGFTLTHIELTQLTAAVAARQAGATVEEAILAGFGAKKGGSAAYKRAKELFDVATAPPAA